MDVNPRTQGWQHLRIPPHPSHVALYPPLSLSLLRYITPVQIHHLLEQLPNRSTRCRLLFLHHCLNLV